MYKQCKTAQSAARQRQLEMGLLQSMSVRNFEEISVSELCQRLQIPRKSFYRYFDSKDGALWALLDHTLQDYDTFVPEPGKTASKVNREELYRFFAFWQHQKKLLDALQRSGLSGVLIERTIRHALSRRIMHGRFLPEDSPEMQKQVTVFSICGLMSMVLTWHHSGYPQTAAEMAAVAARLLSRPLFSETDPIR